MSTTEPLIRNISDTALWAAVYRARETEREDSLFRDPFARGLAGKRGEQIAGTMHFSNVHTWSWLTRTWLFDRFIAEQVADGVDMVLNLAAGLDARPYRMDLPAKLRWVEVDLPDLLDYKEAVLGKDEPRCRLERVRLDLSRVAERRALFARLGNEAKKILVLTEGLIIYFTEPQVGELARDLAAVPSIQRWITDLASPGLVAMLQKKMGAELAKGGARLQFGPEAGVEFFLPHGWRSLDARSMLHTAARLKRLPWFLRIAAMFPDKPGPKGRRPWSAICLLAKV